MMMMMMMLTYHFRIACFFNSPKWYRLSVSWAVYTSRRNKRPHLTETILVFPKIGVPQNGWLIMENPIKMYDLGVPLFSETSIYFHLPCTALDAIAACLAKRWQAWSSQWIKGQVALQNLDAELCCSPPFLLVLRNPSKPYHSHSHINTCIHEKSPRHCIRLHYTEEFICLWLRKMMLLTCISFL